MISTYQTERTKMSNVETTAAIPQAITPIFYSKADITRALGISPGKAPKVKVEKETDLPELNSDVEKAATDATSALEAIANDKSAARTWDRWMEVAKGVALLQQAATDAADGKTIGAKYSNAMNGLLKKYQLDRIDRFTRSRLMKCYNQRSEIETWLKEHTNNTGRIINHPAVALVEYEKREDAPAKQRPTVDKVVKGLFDHFTRTPEKVVQSIIFKHCMVPGQKNVTDPRAVAVLAQSLKAKVDAAFEQSEKNQDATWHPGYQYLQEMVKAFAKAPKDENVAESVTALSSDETKVLRSRKKRSK
jgi:hypothetical protein